MNQTSEIPPYSSVRTEAIIVTVLLVISVLLKIGQAVIDYQTILFLESLNTDNGLSEKLAERLISISDLEIILSRIYAAVFLLTGAFFLLWLYDAVANLPSLGVRDARWSPGWSVGWWFIPIMFLFRPYQVMRDLSVGSTPERKSVHDHDMIKGEGTIVFWWCLFLISIWFSQRDGSAGATSQNLEQISQALTALEGYLWLSIIGYFLTIVCAITAIMIVRSITSRQETKRALLENQPSDD